MWSKGRTVLEIDTSLICFFNQASFLWFPYFIQHDSSKGYLTWLFIVLESSDLKRVYNK